jgi:urease accessory protein
VLCKRTRDKYRLAVVTNDIHTKEDERLLLTAQALPPDRIMGLETGGLPAHGDPRERVDQPRGPVERMCRRFPDLDLFFIESGGDNLAATLAGHPMQCGRWRCRTTGWGRCGGRQEQQA